MSSRPNRSCRASQPSTQPGTVPARTSPRIGMAVRPSARIAAASDPAPAWPIEVSAAGSSPPSWTSANRSPPIPHMCWVVTASTALVAMAASAALPPARRMPTPADDARWSTEHTMPLGAVRVMPTSEMSSGRLMAARLPAGRRPKRVQCAIRWRRRSAAVRSDRPWRGWPGQPPQPARSGTSRTR